MDNSIHFSVKNNNGTAEVNYDYCTDQFKSAYINIKSTKATDTNELITLLKAFKETVYIDTKASVDAHVAISTILDVGYNIWQELGFSITFENTTQEDNFYTMVEAITPLRKD